MLILNVRQLGDEKMFDFIWIVIVIVLLLGCFSLWVKLRAEFETAKYRLNAIEINISTLFNHSSDKK